jgi:hypothetical protein
MDDKEEELGCLYQLIDSSVMIIYYKVKKLTMSDTIIEEKTGNKDWEPTSCILRTSSNEVL